MKKNLRISLQTSQEQKARLHELQQLFARACNALAPTVRDSRCWNRVVLHHMTYKALREQFPALGSQMACNAIYSVCRASRAVYQGAGSPFNLARLGDRTLPLIRFADNCPVYFDRHTLSVKSGQLSLFTLDGRMRFQLGLCSEDEAAFQQGRLREIVLMQRADGEFELNFWLEPVGVGEVAERAPHSEEWPEYLMVEEKIA
jgi:hypothetical protein